MITEALHTVLFLDNYRLTSVLLMPFASSHYIADLCVFCGNIFHEKGKELDCVGWYFIPSNEQENGASFD